MSPKSRLSAPAACLAATVAFYCPSYSHAASIDHGGLGFLFDEPITLSVSGTPMRESDVPVDMTIISAEEIANAGAMTIPDLLRYYSGLDVRQFSANSYSVGIRGYNQPYNPRLLVLANGRPIYLDFYGLTAWSALPFEHADIRQIEIMRGPNTALMGFNAVSGVINFITYNPIYDQQHAGKIAVGTDGQTVASGTGTFQEWGEYGVRLSASSGFLGEHDDGYGNAFDQAFEVDDKRNFIGLHSMFALDEQTHIEFEAGRVEARYDDIDPQSSVADATYHLTHFRSRLFADSDFGLWTLDAYRNDIDLDYQRSLFNVVPVFSAFVDTRNQVVSLANRFVPASGHNVRLGAEVRDVLNNSNTIDVGHRNFALSGAWDWSISDQFSTLASLRYDYLNYQAKGRDFPPLLLDDLRQGELNELSYNLAGIYKPFDHTALRASTARGVQIPTILGRSVGIPPTPFTSNLPQFGDPDLDPTIVTTYEIGAEHALEAWESNVSATLFFQQFEDLRSIPGTTLASLGNLNGTPGLLVRNVGDSQSWGIELGIDGEFTDSGRFAVNYTYQDIDDDLDVNQTNFDYPIVFEGGTPQHGLNVTLGYDFGTWHANLFGRWQSGFDQVFTAPGVREQKRSVGSTIDLSTFIGYRVDDRLELGFTATNLLGQDTSLVTDIDRRFIASARITLN